MKIWRLQTKSDAFGYPFSASQEDIKYYLDVLKKFYTGQKIAEHWKPTMICGLHESDIGRLISFEEEYWVFTEKVKTLVAPLIRDAVEYLPLYSRKESHKKISRIRQLTNRSAYAPIIETIHSEQQYILNILDIKPTEIINFEQSQLDFGDEENREIYEAEKLVFHPQAIEGSHLFKIANPGSYFKSATFISDELREIIETNYLSGCQIVKRHESEGGSLVWTSEQV